MAEDMKKLLGEIAELKKDRERFRLVIESAPNAMVLVDKTGRIILVNKQTELLFGFGREELLGQSMEILVPPHFRVQHSQDRTGYFHSPQTKPMGAGRDLCGLRKNGTEVPIEIGLNPIETAEGTFILAVIADITERKRIEEARLRLHLSSIVDSSEDAIISKTLDGLITSWNKSAEKLYGYSEEMVKGKSVSLLMPPHKADDVPQILEKIKMGEKAAPYETQRMKKDGTIVDVSLTVSPIRDADGLIVGASTIARDITEQKRLEEQLHRKNEELAEQNYRIQEANRLKSEFLANMSHELRTPLNSVIGFAELIHDAKAGPVSDSQKEFLGDILASARHLLQLINDVLDLSKIESGKMEFCPEEVDLMTLSAELRDTFRSLASRKKIHIDVQIHHQLKTVYADPFKLKQVLYNYLSNAIKFTPEEGRVVLRLDPEGENDFRLTVEDTGIGIRPEDIERLFVEFQQLDSSGSKKYQGTGLGLALTKRIVEAQGGKVDIKSEVGKGSQFVAILPRG